MRIVYILHSLNIISPNTVIVNIIKNIVSQVQEILVISLFQSREDNYKNLLTSINVKFIEYKSYDKAFEELKNLSNIINKYDILHLNQHKSFEIGKHLCEHNNHLKVISTCHSVEDVEVKEHKYSGYAKISAKRRLREQGFFYKNHSKVVAVSNEVEKYLFRIECINTSVIYNGVNYEAFPKNPFYKRKSNEISFAQVGHIMPLKNQLYSLKLIRYLRMKNLTAKLHLFGGYMFENGYKRELLRYIKKYNLEESVFFHGEVQWDSLFKFLKNIDILLMPSTTEGLPLALIETFYFSMSSIVSNNGGMKEIVKNYKNGLVIDNVKNQKNFKKVYINCIKKRYLKEGKNNKRNLVQKFSSKNMAQKYYDEYIKLLNL
ncbi:glycosyltransferase family 4 protein [Arcobacter sp.]|uniref:glycosyltransferase family 4 protein n=1 Tax=Arcobacter sp. TaxID=1872629 RepID=UPI003D13F0C5